VKSSRKHSYELCVKSETSQLAVIRDFINKYAEENHIPGPVSNAIILAVDEAATNIVKHAYHYAADKEIHITLCLSKDECTVSLTDFGDSFDPSLIPQPNMKEYLQQHRVGGLGLYLIRTLMDSMEYKTDPRHSNKLILKKKLS
jgi:serine/threonine-protein kinase RsbW